MLTPYQFASNTPISAIDLDGLEAFLSTKRNSDGSTQITLHIHLDVKNSTNYDRKIIDKVSSGVKNLLERELQGFDKGANTHMNTKVVIKNNDDVSFDNNIGNGGNNYFIDFVGTVEARDKLNSWMAGYTGSTRKDADADDWIGNTDFNRLQVKIGKGDTYKELIRTASHEVLHSLGLYHPSDDDNDIPVKGRDNLAQQSIVSSGTDVNLQQLKRVIAIVGGDVPNKNGRFNTRTKFL